MASDFEIQAGSDRAALARAGVQAVAVIAALLTLLFVAGTLTIVDVGLGYTGLAVGWWVAFHRRGAPCDA